LSCNIPNIKTHKAAPHTHFKRSDLLAQVLYKFDEFVAEAAHTQLNAAAQIAHTKVEIGQTRSVRILVLFATQQQTAATKHRGKNKRKM
jgi:hypothetical protein